MVGGASEPACDIVPTKPGGSPEGCYRALVLYRTNDFASSESFGESARARGGSSNDETVS
jgi:hypothetical protein